MRYCFHCSRITVGEPSFCNFCGRTYDLKWCHRLHANVREAQVCSECGSRDLTTPHPKISFWLRPILFLLSLLPGVALLFLTIAFFFADLYVVFSEPGLQFRFMLLGLVLALLWLVYIQLPGYLRRQVRRRMHKASK